MKWKGRSVVTDLDEQSINIQRASSLRMYGCQACLTDQSLYSSLLSVNSGSGSSFEGSDSGSAPISSTFSQSGRKGGRRGRKSFKEWQDDSRWDLKVFVTPRITC